MIESEREHTAACGVGAPVFVLLKATLNYFYPCLFCFVPSSRFIVVMDFCFFMVTSGRQGDDNTGGRVGPLVEGV